MGLISNQENQIDFGHFNSRTLVTVKKNTKKVYR